MILGGDRLSPDAAFGKRDVFGNPRIQMMADHQHVEVLVDGVDRERPRGVGRGRQHIRLAAHADDIRRMSAACTFGMIRVDRSPGERGDGVLYRT